MKTFPLSISKTFMAGHPRRGEPTYFSNKILLTVDKPEETFEHKGKKFFLDRNAYDKDTAFQAGWSPKIHTIRENYPYWARIAEEVNAGRGILSLRQWSGSPYNYKREGSKPVEFLQLTKMGIQKVKIEHIPISGSHIVVGVNVEGAVKNIDLVARNDGLSVDDFCKWFKKDTEGCIIHFTEFLY
jgi:hypothetical protein